MTVPIAELLDELRTLYRPPFGAPSTFVKIRQVVGEFGERAGCPSPADWSPAAIARWFGAYPGRSPATARSLLSSFRRAATYAVFRRWLDANPFSFRPFGEWFKHAEPTDPEGQQRHHPVEDLARVMARLAAGTSTWQGRRLHALAAATLLSGARAREVRCSRVADWDLPRRTFSVRPNERRRLKTAASRRPVILPADLVPILAGWFAEAGSEWAFPGAKRVGPWDGGPPGLRPLDRLKDEGKAAGVEGLTWLSLRHSYVTHSRGVWGVPEGLTQRLCGHTRRQTTDGYAGLDRPTALAAVDRIGIGLLAPPTSAA